MFLFLTPKRFIFLTLFFSGQAKHTTNAYNSNLKKNTMSNRPDYHNDALVEIKEARTLLRSAADTLIWNGELQHYLRGGLGETPQINTDAYLHDSYDPDVQALSTIIKLIEQLQKKMTDEFNV
jgi:hypothetical protein